MHGLMWLVLPFALRRFHGQLAALKRAIEQKTL